MMPVTAPPKKHPGSPLVFNLFPGLWPTAKGGSASTGRQGVIIIRTAGLEGILEIIQSPVGGFELITSGSPQPEAGTAEL